MEKRHCKQGTIAQLKIDDNDFVSTDKEILNECESFYQNLYSSKVNGKENRDDFFPTQPNQRSLNKYGQLLCEGLLSRKECLEALKTMAPEKTPGTDGFPCEFYKIFWNDVAEILTNALNYSYEKGKLSVSQRRGILKLIPKKDAELNLIKNWRPLRGEKLNYKMAAKDDF